MDRGYIKARSGNCSLAPHFREYIKELFVFCQAKTTNQGGILLIAN